MARLPTRVRLWDQLMRRTPAGRLDELSDDEVVAMRERGAPEGRLRDAVFGSVAEGVRVDERVVAGGDGQELRLRSYHPRAAAQDAPLVVFFHGGGFALGAPEMCDNLGSTIAQRVGAVVVAPEYRLAPTHPFPAAVQDATAVLRWVAEHGDEIGADAGRLAVMGDSAGGNLAAVMALVARDEGGPDLRAQVLLYPVVEQRSAAASRSALADAPILTAGMMQRFHAMYLPHADDALDWRASPLLADAHDGLPPALVQVAEHDPLRDEGHAYAATLEAAGVPVRLTEYVGMPHGFHTFPGLVGASGAQARHELCAFLAAHL